MLVVRAIVFAVGVTAVLAILFSALRTVVLPRGVPSRLSRTVFILTRKAFRLRVRPGSSYERRDRIMALYGPSALFVLLAVWVCLVIVAYEAMYWGLTDGSIRGAFILSGSAIFTLGFERPDGLGAQALAFSEAAIGLVLLALLITYLPSLYGAFSRREAAVTALEVRAGSPPSGVEMIERYFRLERPDKLNEVWTRWEDWFVEVEETHTSFPAIAFFRSPQPDHSWVTAAGAVLDGASLLVSSIDVPHDVQADICIRAGYLALRRVTDFFRIPSHHDPHYPDHPVSVRRDEFEAALDRLALAGAPIKPDRDQAWQDFAGWRVNYDDVLLSLAGLTMAPIAPWSSDRSLQDWSPPLIRRVAKSRALAIPDHQFENV
jgi:hypothetical protein